MNGPDHYLEAERLLGRVKDLVETVADGNDDVALGAAMQITVPLVTAMAQVHATLAQAAATALAASFGADGPSTNAAFDWRTVIR